MAWNHNYHYHPLLLRAVPPGSADVLDVGCGDGTLARKLAGVSERVVALDLSPDMVARARELSAAVPSVAVAEGDFLTYPFDAATFDFISSVATVHHMDWEATLLRMRELLRPGGVLAIVGLARASTPLDVFFRGLGFVAHRFYRRRHQPAEPGAPLRDPAMSYRAVRRSASRLLPGMTFRRRVLFRYTLVWRKPGDGREP